MCVLLLLAAVAIAAAGILISGENARVTPPQVELTCRGADFTLGPGQLGRMDWSLRPLRDIRSATFRWRIPAGVAAVGQPGGPQRGEVKIPLAPLQRDHAIWLTVWVRAD
jgi:hypothetical protein